VLALWRRELGVKPEINEGIRVRAGDNEDGTPVSAIAAARTAARDEFFASERQAPAPAVTGRNADLNFVNEHQEIW
jgi:hypothetical protein